MASVAHFLHGLSLNVYLHLPGYVKELGAGEIEIGALFGAAALPAVVLRPFVGRLMDMRGCVPFIIAGGFLQLAACCLYLTVGHFGPWLYAVRILQGLAQATLFASLFAFAADLVPAMRRIQGLAWFGVSGLLAAPCGGLLGDFVLARSDYRHLFGISIVIAGLAIACSLPLRDVRARLPQRPARHLFKAALEPSLLPIWALGLAFALGVASYYTFLKTFVLERGLGSVGLFFAAYSGTAIVLRIGFGGLPDRVGAKRVLFPALAALSLGLVFLSLARTQTVFTLAGVFCGAGHGFAFPILLGLVVARADPSERGAAMALFTALFDAGPLVGGPLFGTLIHHGGYARMFQCVAGLVLAGILGFVFFERAAHRPKPEHFG